MKTQIGPLELKNPVMLAAGAFRYDRGAGRWLENPLTRPIVERLVLKPLGAIVTKTITLHPRDGYPEPRVIRTASGTLNSIGLANPGIDRFRREVLPIIAGSGVPVIVSLTGTPEEVATMAKRLTGHPVAAIELNLSCPNTTGPVFDRQQIISQMRKLDLYSNLPVIVKVGAHLSFPIETLIQIATDEGAIALTVGNSYPGIAIDWRTGKPCLGGVTGGLSGPAIKPLALLAVWRAANCDQLPIIGCGGICCSRDAAEFLAAGAVAVQVGSACLTNPFAAARVVRQLHSYTSQPLSV